MKILALLLTLLNTANATTIFDDVKIENSLQMAGLTADRACYLDNSQNLASSPVTSTELGYLSGVTSAIQTQLDAKQASITTGTTSQYVRGNLSLATLDTSAVPENGNLYYTSVRFDTALSGKSTSDLTEGSNLYYTASRFNTAFGAKSTTDLTEGSNLYYTPTRFNSAFAGKSTTDLSEGSNLYYTATRFNSAFSGKSTSDLTEGSNLYFTNARGIAATLTGYTSGAGTVSASDSILQAIQKLNGNTAALVTGVSSVFSRNGAVTAQSGDYNTSQVTENTNLYYTAARVNTAVKSATSGQAFYVSKDVGSDSNDCSRLSPCASIGAAITASNAISAYYKQTIIHVSAATTSNGYNENVTLSQQGVNLFCDSFIQNGRMCYIKGTLTVNLSGTSGGANYQVDLNEAYMSGFVLSTTSGDNITFSGSAFQRFTLTNTYVDNGGTGSAVVMSNSGTSGAGAKSTFTGYDVAYNSSNSSNPTISLTAGRFWNFGTQTNITNSTANKAVIQSGAASSFICTLCSITGQVQVTNNTANATISLSTIASGSQACIDTPSSASTGTITFSNSACTSTNTNTFTGTGVMVFTPGDVVLSTSGDTASTITQAVVQSLPQGEILLGAGAVKGTNVLLSIKGGHIKITQTTAPTATVNANAGTGATCTLANSSDGAGTMTITTGSVGTPTTGDQCRINFNKAYTVAPICVFSSANATAGANLVGAYRGTRSTTVNNIAFNVAGATSGTYVYDYHCEETQ